MNSVTYEPKDWDSKGPSVLFELFSSPFLSTKYGDLQVAAPPFPNATMANIYNGEIRFKIKKEKNMKEPFEKREIWREGLVRLPADFGVEGMGKMGVARDERRG